jgi:hypothetical protein
VRSVRATCARVESHRSTACPGSSGAVRRLDLRLEKLAPLSLDGRHGLPPRPEDAICSTRGERPHGRRSGDRSCRYRDRSTGGVASDATTVRGPDRNHLRSPRNVPSPARHGTVLAHRGRCRREHQLGDPRVVSVRPQSHLLVHDDRRALQLRRRSEPGNGRRCSNARRRCGGTSASGGRALSSSDPQGRVHHVRPTHRTLPPEDRQAPVVTDHPRRLVAAPPRDGTRRGGPRADRPPRPGDGGDRGGSLLDLEPCRRCGPAAPSPAEKALRRRRSPSPAGAEDRACRFRHADALHASRSWKSVRPESRATPA